MKVHILIKQCCMCHATLFNDKMHHNKHCILTHLNTAKGPAPKHGQGSCWLIHYPIAHHVWPSSCPVGAPLRPWWPALKPWGSPRSWPVCSAPSVGLWCGGPSSLWWTWQCLRLPSSGTAVCASCVCVHVWFTCMYVFVGCGCVCVCVRVCVCRGQFKVVNGAQMSKKKTKHKTQNTCCIFTHTAPNLRPFPSHNSLNRDTRSKLCTLHGLSPW